jgi:hypothetical protein
MTDMFRCIPTQRVKEFVEHYISTNYEMDEASGDEGYTQFAFDSGVPYRRVYGIRQVEFPNLSFDFVDRMLTNLDMTHMWHLPPEEGGFSDYYHVDIPPAPAEQTPEQRRRRSDDNARRRARKSGQDYMDVLYERALGELVAA